MEQVDALFDSDVLLMMLKTLITLRRAEPDAWCALLYILSVNNCHEHIF